MVLNYKTPSYTLTKSYKLFIDNIAQINELNCITVQFSDSKNSKQNLKLNWLNVNSVEIDSLNTTIVWYSDPPNTGPSRRFWLEFITLFFIKWS